jgi:putative lipoprotein
VVFADGQVSGSGGCNSYGGKYEVHGNKLTTSEIVSTMMACADQSTMDQEAAFLGALGRAETFKITNDKLEIATSDGKTMAFTRQ